MTLTKSGGAPMCIDSNRLLTAALALFCALLAMNQRAAAQSPVFVPSNSWGTGAPMPTARETPFTGVIGQKIYVIGGNAGGSTLNVNEVYDTTTNTWTTAAPIPTPRWDGAGAVVNGILFAIGGGTATSNVSNVVEAYDPIANTWSTKALMPTSLNSIYAIVENGLIYVIGGFNGSRESSLLAYNPAANTWSTLAPLAVAKSQPAVGLLGSAIIAAGGLANSGATTDNAGYNAATNSWTALAPLPAARQAGCFGVSAGLLYFASGNSSSSGPLLSSMIAYDPSANAWTTALPPIPNAITNPGSAVVGGQLYCLGGSNTFRGNPYNYVQIYQPPLSPPSISLNGIVPVYSAASVIQSGSWVSIYGNNLAPTTAVWNGNFPTSLGNTTVSIDGKPAYLWFVSPTQINLQVPDDNATGSVLVAVTTPGGKVSSIVTLGTYAPSFSLLSAKYPAAIVITPGSPGNSGGGYDIIGPAGAFSYPTRPAKSGETLILYGVGFGPTTPAIPAGQAFSGAAPSLTLPQITIGGVQAQVAFAGIVEAGLFQFNVVIPSAGSGDQPLSAIIGGMTTPGNVYITLQ
jgi:uncharacterized protein (TIGR03437 family)